MTKQRRSGASAIVGILAALSVSPAASAAELGLPRATIVLDASPAKTVAPSKDELFNAAQEAVRAHASALGVDPQQALVADSIYAGKYGPGVVTFRQTASNLDVFGARISAALDGAGRVRAISGGFSPHVKSAAQTSFKLTASAATLVLLKAVGLSSGADVLKALPSRNGYQYFSISSKSFAPLGPARAKALYFPTGERVIAAYYIEATARRTKSETPEGWGAVVSAETGEILTRGSLIHEAVHSYRVYADAAGAPLTDAYGDTLPHPTAVRDGWRPTTPTPMRRVTLDHFGLSAGDPWLALGATHTIGNNVDAFFNGLIADGGVWTYDGEGPAFTPAEGDFRAPLSSAGAFEYTYDPSTSAGDYFQRPGQPATPIPAGAEHLNAKIVQAFYATNWLHDVFHELGFDEASGNAQHDNYGRGGLANDRLIVNAAYAATFVYTPADGESPHLRLGLNGYSGTRRDPSGFDFPVIAHEWTHVMFRRLAGMGFGGQTGALNEGTADFVGLLLATREPHRDALPRSSTFSGAYGIGAYFNRDYDFPIDTLPAAGSPGYPDNTYYHGIRRFPYSADRSLNPLTLRHIEHEAPLPGGVAPFDWKLRSLSNAEVHTAGEVWASALWQCARNILADEARFAFEERKRRMLAYLVAGLKLFPADANFIEARNAVLFAVRAADPTDYELCRQGFITRGFGAGALAPARTSAGNHGLVESFATADVALSFVGSRLEEISGGDGDGVLDVGENGRLTVTLKNTGFAALDQVSIYVPPLAWAYTFPAGSTASGVVLQPGEEYTTSFDVRIVTSEGAPMLLFNLTARDALRSDVRAQQDALFTVNYDLRRDNMSDWLVSQQGFEADWTTGFESGHGCPGTCDLDLTNWRRVSHLGDFAYRVGSQHVALDAHLTTAPFTVHAAAPLRITFVHDFDLDRTGVYTGGALGEVEISVDDGAWESLAPYLVSGRSQFGGASGGWRTDVADVGTAFGGRSVRLRWRISSNEIFAADPIHWALSRISIAGASSPMFSSMYIDVR